MNIRNKLAAAMLAIGMATGAPAKAETPKKAKPAKVEKGPEAETPKLTAYGSLHAYVMDDRTQLDGKLGLNYGKFGAFGRLTETIDYQGNGSTFVVGDISYQMPAGLSMLGEVQYLQGVGTHGRFGISAYHSKALTEKLKLSSYNQATVSLTEKPDCEVLSNTGLELRLRPISLVARTEGIVNFGRGINYYIVRPFVGVRYRNFEAGGYMQVTGSAKGRPDVAGGVGIGANL